MAKRAYGKKGKLENFGIEDEIADEASRREEIRAARQRKQDTPDGMASAEDMKEVFARQNEGRQDSNVLDLNLRRPIKSSAVHSVPVVQNSVERTSVYRTGPTPETAKRKPLVEKSAEEKLAESEEEITVFNSAEKIFIGAMTADYEYEFSEASERRKEKGAIVNEAWANAFRHSYIKKRLGWGSDRQLAREKINMLENYLNLKLPKGLIEEKPAEVKEITEESKEKNFTPEQQKVIENIKQSVPGFYALKQEESKGWEGFSDKERKNTLEVYMKGALGIQYKKRLVSIGAPSDSEAIKEFIEDVMKTII